MAVRPPQGDDDDEPEVVAFGIAALGARIDEAGVTFPATAEEVLDALDEPSVPYNAAGNSLPLSEALDQAPRREFERKTELLDTLHPIFERRRQQTNSSIVARLRGLLPF
ncbi:MAG: hypothetical protein J07HB67_02040 [halophilic archaeon J07HB67]|nr:MAG: hypothetical protein J07HB67_02040 [halophilic archaeon J07HB67]